jgi:2-keto-4-pentenoate hydratase/2-oxohepta-3-ene-1,7-dioic acid hydratase in catechol pathway
MKIICIGRNYDDHISELKNERPQQPLFFMKPDTALIPKNLPFFIPDFSNEIHYEVEIVLKICKVGKHIQKQFAHSYFDQIALGIDFTARDIQEHCRKNGLPWEPSKAFDFSAPVSKFFPVSEFKDISNIDFSLEKNGEVVQKGNTSHMLFGVDEIISHVSQYVTLKNGDLIFTGTPAGVGPVAINDVLKGFLFEKQVLTVKVK